MTFKHAILIVAAVAGLATMAFADAKFIVSTDRVSYTGTLTKYATLADAQAQTNPVGGPYTIPNRDTAAPYNTAYRDAGMYFVKNMPAYDPQDANILLTAWWYTTDPNHGAYSGWGNPNNTNTGFLQLYDGDGSTETAASASFSDWDGTYWTTFTLEVNGLNAIYDANDPSNDYARLWHAPGIGGAGGLTKGIFHTYDLDVTFGGLQGQAVGGDIVATDHPDSVVGTFTGIFENTNTLDPQYNGFYVIDYTFGMDNWAWGNQGDLNGAFSDSLFAVPAPGAVVLGMIGLGLIGWVKRRFA